MRRKAIIISISGIKLNNKEKKLFLKHKPWGVILFRRNIKSYDQLKNLIQSIKKITRDRKYPIMIDEEGGTVTRLEKIFENSIMSQRLFGKLYEKNKRVGINIYKYYNDQICLILKDLGININTVPILDKLYKNTHMFLRDRIYSDNIKTIKCLSNICIKSYKKNKILTVIKHIPGHGLAKKDSHKALPIINKSTSFLMKNDFKCFKNTKSHLAMTAHILLKKIDENYCVTHSQTIIKNLIRKKIGFKGILISDDIGMLALKYGIVENALKALSAGCNLILYCKGNYKQSLVLLNKLPFIDKFTQKKTSEIYKFLR